MSFDSRTPSSPSNRPSRGGGCLFVLATCVVSLLLFGLNNTLVQAIYAAVAVGGPEWLAHPNTAQFVMFAGPVALLFAQWWLVELVLQSLRARRR